MPCWHTLPNGICNSDMNLVYNRGTKCNIDDFLFWWRAEAVLAPGFSFLPSVFFFFSFRHRELFDSKRALLPSPPPVSVSMDLFSYRLISGRLSLNVSSSSIVNSPKYKTVLLCRSREMILMIFKKKKSRKKLVVEYLLFFPRLYWLWIATYRNKFI